MTDLSSQIPPFAPLPPSAFWDVLSDSDWASCLDSWTVLAEIRLNLSAREFDNTASKDESAAEFLTSYFACISSKTSTTALRDGNKARKLRKLCFVLARRLLLEIARPPPSLLDWKLLAHALGGLPKARSIDDDLKSVWTKHRKQMELSLEQEKSALVKGLSFNKFDNEDVIRRLHLLTVLALHVFDAGNVLVAGSDYIDVLASTYTSQEDAALRKAIVANIYAGFNALMHNEPPHLSALLDQLFELKASADRSFQRNTQKQTVLSDLICSTNFLAHLQHSLEGSAQQRGTVMYDALISYKSRMSPLHPQTRKKKPAKGKGAAISQDGAVHVHKLSLVTQIQDLFPDLNNAHVLRLLDAYDDDVEVVTAHLLDGSLPEHLQISDEVTSPQQDAPEQTMQDSYSIPSRANIFDDDELIKNANKLSYGRSKSTKTADVLLDDRSNHNQKKAAIISALAAFDSDDDERDDTYDVADVGGTVDSALPGTDDAEANKIRRENGGRAEPPASPNDETLYKVWKEAPALFARDSNTRRSKVREQLRRETGLTDEAIEGWAVMLSRDQNRITRLEAGTRLQAGARANQQHQLQRTSYRRPAGDDEGENTGDSETGGNGASRGTGGRGRGRGRGRGGGTGRGGGDVAGPTGERSTEGARHHKDVNKASRANHNRRAGRAKKMSRGMI